VASVTLAYDERGDGPGIVFLHGHPFSRAMWSGQLAALGDEFRVVAPDLPGYGASPAAGRTISMRAIADAVVGLLDALALERATVVGLSMGGLVAMELGLGYPERVDGVVLAATTAAPVTDEEAERRRATAAQIERDGMLGHTLEMLPRLFGPAGSRDPELTVPIVTTMLRTDPVGPAAALRGRAERPDYATLLAVLRPPALVIAGDHDAYSTNEITDQLVASLPGPEVLILEGVGHFPNLEAPERFDEAVRAFARRVSGSGSEPDA
jgi:pimeloyl-ACP methyl ester carboxylesterase